jgi:uncharacterized protein (TIGR02996 family)
MKLDPDVGPPMTDAERAELADRLDRMVNPPHRSDIGGQQMLLWSRRGDDGKAQMMMWTPETPDELRGAELFYDAAHGLNAFARKIKAGKPAKRAGEETALINAILQNRDDRTGYLVYADYLTERGDSLGDYIRKCAEADALPPDHPDRERLSREASDLADAHAEEWFAPLGEIGLRPEVHGHFTPYAWQSLERGVIEEVTIDRPGLFPDHADRLFAAAPFLRKLEFKRGHFDPAALAKVKQLSQIDELELFHTDLTADQLRALLKSKHLTGLKKLGLWLNPLGDDGAEVLAKWPGLAKLESVNVSSCQLSSDGVRVLMNAPGLANLTTLRIGGNNAGTDCVHLVAHSPHLKRLTELDLGSSEFPAGSTSLFGRAAFAGALRTLTLDTARFQPGAFEALAQCQLPALRVLKLNSVSLRATMAAHLARAPFVATLEELYLDNCSLGDGAATLFQGRFPKLKVLDLSRNRLQRTAAEWLSGAAKNFPALANLRLWSNRLTAESVAVLAGSKVLANLTDLDLSDNRIGPAGAAALANSKHLPKLKTLVVDEKTVGKKGKKALIDRFGESAVSFR